MDARLELVEAAYRFDLSEQAHLAHLLDVMSQRFEPVRPMLAFTSSLANGRSHYGSVAAAHFERPMPIDVFFDERAAIPSDDVHRMFHSSPARHSLVTLTGASYRATVAALGIPEFVGLNCPTGTGASLVIGAVWSSAQRISVGERQYWAPVAHHLATQKRIRDRVRPEVDAVVSVDRRGYRFECLAPEGISKHDREALRRAILQRERIRSGSRSMADRVWPDLVRGRWTIIDRFESTGHRYVVAIRNPRAVSELQALTAREHRIADALIRGDANKAIAIDLGVSEATVSRSVRHVLQKLGIGVAELIALSRGSVTSIDLASERLGLLELPAPTTTAAQLTASERAVVAAMLTGMSTAHIASARGVSNRTVINQLRAVYEKLGVHSRRELILAFVSPPRAVENASPD